MEKRVNCEMCYMPTPLSDIVVLCSGRKICKRCATPPRNIVTSPILYSPAYS